MDRIEHSGAAPATTLAAPLGQGASLFTATDGTGYPEGATGTFYVTVDRGVSGLEETIRCESRSGNTFTVATGGRGASGSSDTTHAPGATVEHTFPAAEADAINVALIDLDTRGVTLEARSLVALFNDATVYGATTPGQTKVSAASLGTVVLPQTMRLLIRSDVSIAFDNANLAFDLALGARITPVGSGTAEADYLSVIRPITSLPNTSSGFISARVLTPALAAGTYQVRALMQSASSSPSGQGVAFVWPQLTVTGAPA